jgi:DNA-binding HxlR family transcriptional regulator
MPSASFYSILRRSLEASRMFQRNLESLEASRIFQRNLYPTYYNRWYNGQEFDPYNIRLWVGV